MDKICTAGVICELLYVRSGIFLCVRLFIVLSNTRRAHWAVDHFVDFIHFFISDGFEFAVVDLLSWFNLFVFLVLVAYYLGPQCHPFFVANHPSGLCVLNVEKHSVLNSIAITTTGNKSAWWYLALVVQNPCQLRMTTYICGTLSGKGFHTGVVTIFNHTRSRF